MRGSVIYDEAQHLDENLINVYDAFAIVDKKLKIVAIYYYTNCDILIPSKKLIF